MGREGDAPAACPGGCQRRLTQQPSDTFPEFCRSPLMRTAIQPGPHRELSDLAVLLVATQCSWPLMCGTTCLQLSHSQGLASLPLQLCGRAAGEGLAGTSGPLLPQGAGWDSGLHRHTSLTAGQVQRGWPLLRTPNWAKTRGISGFASFPSTCRPDLEIAKPIHRLFDILSTNYGPEPSCIEYEPPQQLHLMGRPSSPLSVAVPTVVSEPPHLGFTSLRDKVKRHLRSAAGPAPAVSLALRPGT